MSTLIHHVDVKAFTGKKNRVFRIILVLSASCALYFIFCFKQNRSFGNNVLRLILTSFHFPSLPVICDCIPFWAFKSVFNRKEHSKNYLQWWFKLSVDSFSLTLSFPYCMLDLLKYNGEFVFMRKKKFHLLLNSKKYSHLRLGKQEFPPSKESIFSVGINFEPQLFKQSFLLILQV